eukprot:gene8524-biopygen5714
MRRRWASARFRADLIAMVEELYSGAPRTIGGEGKRRARGAVVRAPQFTAFHRNGCSAPGNYAGGNSFPDSLYDIAGREPSVNDAACRVAFCEERLPPLRRLAEMLLTLWIQVGKSHPPHLRRRFPAGRQDGNKLKNTEQYRTKPTQVPN